MISFFKSRSSQITVLAAAILAGILIGRAGWGIDIWWAISLAIVAMIFVRWRPRLAFFIVVGIALLFGVWRGNETVWEKSHWSQLEGQKVELIGIIKDDPTRNEKGQMVFTLGSIQQNSRNVGGKVRVYTNYKKLQRGYYVRAEGKIVKNLGSVPMRFTFAQIEVISDKTGYIDQFRQHMFASTRSAIPDSLAGFGLGLLIGVKGLIPDNLQETLTIVGLTHLIAVSGYNLTIIVLFVNRSLGAFSTYIATATSLWLITGFMLVTGFSASIVRAAFVAGLALMAQYYGHKVKPIVLIAIPVAITAAINPSYLTSDLGWQLSFLAFAGILILAPLIEQRIFSRPNTITSLLTQSFAAHLMTFPLILLIFKSVSVVAPLTNLLILPLVPLAMLLSFITGLSGLISPVLASWVGLPATGLLSLMAGIAQWMAGWQWASMQFSVTAPFVVAFYVSIIFLIVALKRSNRGKKSAESPSVLKDRVLA